MEKSIDKRLESLEDKIEIMRSDMERLGIGSHVDKKFYIRVASEELNRCSTLFTMDALAQLCRN